ncbi:MAG: Helix-turn-helix domain [Pseudomonadota bacterium]
MSSNSGEIMISGVQIRGARAVLGWSSEDAAARLGISRQTLHRLETYDDVPPSRTYVIRPSMGHGAYGAEQHSVPCRCGGLCHLWNGLDK